MYIFYPADETAEQHTAEDTEKDAGIMLDLEEQQRQCEAESHAASGTDGPDRGTGSEKSFSGGI